MNNFFVGKGRLVKDPEKGKNYVSFVVAINTPYRRGDEWQEETVFLRCVSFKPRLIPKLSSLKKGDAVMIQGRLIGSKFNDSYQISLNVSDFALIKQVEVKESPKMEERKEGGAEEFKKGEEEQKKREKIREIIKRDMLDLYEEEEVLEDEDIINPEDIDF